MVTVSSTWPPAAAFACSTPASPAGARGWPIAARIATVDGDAVVTVGPVTPLDEAALEVARARMRPNGRGLTNPNRCAEAIYRHVVRFGGPAIAGLNRPPEGELRDFLFSPEDGPLHALAFAWSEADAGFEPPAADLRSVRELVTEQDLLEALTGCVAARQIGAAGLADAYERVLTIQVETIERRAATGLAVGSSRSMRSPIGSGGRSTTGWRRPRSRRSSKRYGAGFA